jgi:3,4-dihydroxy 2-butanone 4-phosphate synthase/GTP cyclohydrolase II
MPFTKVEDAIRDFQAGKLIILVDDEDRENEGDLTIAAEKITPEAVNFMAKHARGLICLAMSGERNKKLGIPQMVSPSENRSGFGTAFGVSIEAALGVTTGISAADRATTILTAVADDAKPEDIVMPGHVFPLKARDGGVLVRTGQTEGSVDLARLAGLKTAAVICEIMNEDGTMSRRPELDKFSKKYNIKVLTIADIIEYRLRKEILVHRVAEATMKTEFGGDFNIIVYGNQVDSKEHVALVKGDIGSEDDVLVRVHSECLTGDVFGSTRCDCGDQLHAAMHMIAGEGKGVVVYMRQEGRGIGLANKVKAYHLQEQGADTVEANEMLGFKPDLRDYGIGAQILVELGVRKLRLLTNNPKKIKGLEGYGLRVVDRVPIEISANSDNYDYLKTKKEKMGHMLTVVGDTLKKNIK